MVCFKNQRFKIENPRNQGFKMNCFPKNPCTPNRVCDLHTGKCIATKKDGSPWGENVLRKTYDDYFYDSENGVLGSKSMHDEYLKVSKTFGLISDSKTGISQDFISCGDVCTNQGKICNINTGECIAKTVKNRPWNENQLKKEFGSDYVYDENLGILGNRSQIESYISTFSERVDIDDFDYDITQNIFEETTEEEPTVEEEIVSEEVEDERIGKIEEEKREEKREDEVFDISDISESVDPSEDIYEIDDKKEIAIIAGEEDLSFATIEDRKYDHTTDEYLTAIKHNRIYDDYGDVEDRIEKKSLVLEKSTQLLPRDYRA